GVAVCHAPRRYRLAIRASLLRGDRHHPHRKVPLVASLTLGSKSPSTYTGHTLVLGVGGTGENPAVLASGDLPRALAKQLDSVVSAVSPSTKVGETAVLAAVPGAKADTLVLVGLGEEPGTDALRRAA